MELETLRQTLLNKKRATEETPFGPQALVYKAVTKMFALVAWQAEPLSISLKCDPDFALVLRAQYPAITAGYHLNKKHWNSVKLDGSVPKELLIDMIDDSYDLVVTGVSSQKNGETFEILPSASHQLQRTMLVDNFLPFTGQIPDDSGATHSLTRTCFARTFKRLYSEKMRRYLQV